MADGEPEEWPSQPQELRALDRSLRCAVCYDLYTGPVVLPCSHSFCSRCIRNCFDVKVKDGQTPVCPSCRKPCDQADLRPSTHLREASAAWLAVRGLLLAHHLQALQQQQNPQDNLKQQPVPQEQPQPAHPAQPPQQPVQQARPPRQQLHLGKRARSAPAVAAAAAPAGKRRLTSAAAAAKQQEIITISESSLSEGNSGDGDEAVDTAGNAAADAAMDAADAVDASSSDGDEPHRQHGTAAAGRRRRCVSPSKSAGAAGGQQGSGAEGSGEGSVDEGEDGDAASDDGGDDDPADSDFEPQEAGQEALPPSRRQQQTTSSTWHNTGKENMSGGRAKQQHSAPPAPQQHSRQQPGYVSCPVCGMSVRAAFINSHVDSCLEKAGGVAAVAPPPSSKKPRQQQQQQPVACPPAQPPGSSSSGGFGSLRRVRRGSPLEPPPKLCFELMKERDLKAKLTGLGLSNDGNKKACVERYTTFRNYVLSLKDSSSSLSLQQAAAEFTKQQRRISRAAARPQALDASLAAVGVAAGGAGSVGVNGFAAAVATDVAGCGAPVDNSFAALIHETRLREQQRTQGKVAQQEQEQQGQEQHSGAQQEAQAAAAAVHPIHGSQQQQQQQHVDPGPAAPSGTGKQPLVDLQQPHQESGRQPPPQPQQQQPLMQAPLLDLHQAQDQGLAELEQQQQQQGTMLAVKQQLRQPQQSDVRHEDDERLMALCMTDSQGDGGDCVVPETDQEEDIVL